MIQRRELPLWFGSSPIAPWTLVASTTSSRRPPASALATISSDSPREYTSAVSMKLIPASSARWMMRTESSWSGSPQAPNIIAPRHSGLTWTPVLPRLRYSMHRTYPLLVVEQCPLGSEAAGVPRERAVGADHAVAGDDDRDPVAAVGAADRSRDAAELARELAVGGRLAVRDRAQAGPDRELERRAVLGQREVEFRALAGEVLVELALDLGERAVVRAGVGVQAMAVGVELGQAVLVRLDVERADRAGEERVHA